MTKEIWDTSTLERHLIQAGDKLSPELHDRIIAQGSAIVPGLLSILNNQRLQRADAPGKGWPPIQVVDLLVELQAEEAIAAMLVELKRLSWETILFNKLVFGLKAFGDRAFDPVMSAYQDYKGHELERSLLEILAELGRKDEALFQAFLSQLETEVELGAMNLASYGDPRGLEPLYKVFDHFEIPSDEDHSMADQAIIELREAIESLGGQLTPDQVRKFEQVLDRRKRLGRQMQAYAALSQPQSTTPIKKEKKLGRNAPCWCGSGKKYKKCHLNEDRVSMN